MPPAQAGLDADQRSRAEIDSGLIMKDELFLAQAGEELLFQATALGHVAVDLRHEEPVAAPFSFGGGERQVGVLDDVA